MKVIQKVLNQENREFAFLAYKELKNGKLNKTEIINDKYDYEKFIDKMVDISDVDSREELENSDAKYFDEKLFYFSDAGDSKEYIITEIILDLDNDKLEEIAELVQDKLDDYKITENHKDVDFDFVLKHIENGNIDLILDFSCEEIKDISTLNEADMLNELFIEEEEKCYYEIIADFLDDLIFADGKWKNKLNDDYKIYRFEEAQREWEKARKDNYEGYEGDLELCKIIENKKYVSSTGVFYTDGDVVVLENFTVNER